MSNELILIILIIYGTICIFGGKMSAFLKKLLELFSSREDEVSGELNVIGTDLVNIELKRHPREVLVFFKDECVVVPCNPRHFDSVEWVLHDGKTCHNHDHHHDKHDHHKNYLTIKWDVSGLRSIYWTVRY